MAKRPGMGAPSLMTQMAGGLTGGLPSFGSAMSGGLGIPKPPSLGKSMSGRVQTPRQHASVEKAAKASVAKRKSRAVGSL